MPSPTSAPLTLPSNISEAAFRLYEPHIRTAVTNFPQETEFGTILHRSAEDRQLSCNTFAARFRDAIVSLRRYHWPTTVDVEKLWKITGDFTIAIDPATGSVWFRNRHSPGRPPDDIDRARTMHPEKGSKTVREIWLKWTIDEVRALCLLIHNERIVGPFILEGQVPNDEATTLEGALNVALTFDAGSNRTIIT